MAKKKEVKTETQTDAETKFNKALELAVANAKALQDLREETQKGFAEYHNTLMLLKERNRLR